MNISMKLTQEQNDAVGARNTSILVSAAAGSGKTAVLTARAISILCDRQNPVSADRLLVVTFTNAAAAEMRERITAAMEKELAQNPQDSYLLRQQLRLPGAPICTIDSFCLNLVNEHFYALGLPPRVGIAPDALQKEIAAAALADVMEEAHEQEPERLRPLIDMMGDTYADTAVEEAVMKLSRFLEAEPFRARWLRDAAACYQKRECLHETQWAGVIFDAADDLLHTRRVEWDAFLAQMELDEQMSAAYYPMYADFAVQMKTLQEVIRAGDWDKSRLMSAALKGRRRGQLRDYANEEMKALADKMWKWTSTAKREAQSLSQKLLGLFLANEQEMLVEIDAQRPHAEYLLTLVSRFEAKLQALKTEKNAFSFSDVEHYARQLLVNENGSLTPTAQELSQHYAEVMVDEYQDVNDLQDMILTALSNGGRRLFLVGDAKQSIYGFKQANPHRFIHRRERYPLYDPDAQTDPDAHDRGDGLILLDCNFRSRTGVTAAVNFLFSQLMSKRAGDIDYGAGEALRPAAVFPPHPDDRAELHLVRRLEQPGGHDPEALYVAQKIKQMVAEGFPLAVAPKEPEQGLRPAQYGDFCVLLRSITGPRGQAYLHAFQAMGVPVRLELKEGFYDRPEILTAVNLLRVIDNPLRDIPLLAALTGPAAALCADEITSLRLAQRNVPLYRALLLYAKENEKAAQFVALIDQLRAYSVTLPANELLEKLFEQTGYFALAGACDDGAAKRENLLLLLQRAAEFEQNGFRGLSCYVRHLDRVIESGDKAPPAALSGQENAVKIMTIHRSKGLQFPVCFVCRCGGYFNVNDLTGRYILHAKAGVAFKVALPKEGRVIESLPQKALQLLGHQSLLAEELRVLYVAMTRAQEKLILTMALRTPEETLTAATAQRELRGGDALAPGQVLQAKGYFNWLLACAAENAPLHPVIVQPEPIEEPPPAAECPGTQADPDVLAELTPIGLPLPL